MQFRIEVRESDNGWEVQVTNRVTGTVLTNYQGENVRRLARSGKGLSVFPLPPQHEVEKIPESAPYRILCQTANEDKRADALRAVLGQDAVKGGVERFGCYLFAVLLGLDWWKQIVSQARTSPIELALSWPSDDRVFSTLPWETMHAGGEISGQQAKYQNFLAAVPGLTITRRVKGSTAELPSIESPPRVLFVVGSDIHKDVIRPGAEYLGLLRGLQERDTGLYLVSRLLLEANTNRLEKAILKFRPNVVHFICHGVMSDNRAYLQLFNNDPQEKEPAYVDARTLVAALSPSEEEAPNTPLPPPPIVVLNACTTATSSQLAIGRPLAAELVLNHIPVVVGMSGQVSDQACRMFVRGFYEAVLSTGEISRAAALGRRAALVHGNSDPTTSVDWALPVLFLSEVVAEPRLDLRPVPSEIQRQKAARDFTPHEFPTFCGRLDLIKFYDQLMSSKADAKNMPDWPTPVQVLAVADQQSDAGEAGVESQLFGRTWLLEEIAAQAMRDGHVPVLVSKKKNGRLGYPKELREYLQDLVYWAIQDTVQIFRKTDQHKDLEWDWKYLPQLFSLGPNDVLPADFPKGIPFQKGLPSEPRTVASVMRHELLNFLETVRSDRPAAGRTGVRLLLLIDDLHRMNIAGEVIELLDRFGARLAPDDIRAVFTYSEVPASGQDNAVARIKEFIKHPYVRPVSLEKFHDPNGESWTEEQRSRAQLIYRHYLMHWQENKKIRPLAPARPDQDHQLTQFFISVGDEVKGIPSYLEMKPGPLIRAFIRLNVLREANDEDLLEQQKADEP